MPMSPAPNWLVPLPAALGDPDGLGDGLAAKTLLIGSAPTSEPPTPTSAAYLRNALRSLSLVNWITERPSKGSWFTCSDLLFQFGREILSDGYPPHVYVGWYDK